jgi:hypothetical protein
MTPEVKVYLKTLRLIPAETIRSMATRPFKMGDPAACLCGWAIRDDLLRVSGKDTYPDDEYGDVAEGYSDEMVRQFGGTWDQWEDVFRGVIRNERQLIEEAFAIRVSECVR